MPAIPTVSHSSVCATNKFDDGSTICFTGHRPARLGGYEESNPTATLVKTALARVIHIAYDQGFTDFIAGGALGVDTWAAEAVLELRKTALVTLTIYVPFQGFNSRWPDYSRQRFNDICSSADSVVICSPSTTYNPKLLFERNERMVDDSKALIAVWDGSNSGGTAHCIDYAKSKGRRIIVIDPNSGSAYTLKY